MKVLVLSDSHGTQLLSAFEKERPDCVLFLGDGARDADRLFDRSGATPVCRVSGNCDFADSEPQTKLLDLAGRRIVMTHGHGFSVKSGLSALLGYAKSVNADIALFGHTHVRFSEERDGVLLLNPGAAVNGRYAVLELDGDITVNFGDIYE